MSIVSIILGFSYPEYTSPLGIPNPNKLKYLPGMITDTYMAYKKSLEIGADKIVIITDVISNVNPTVLVESVNRGITKTDIFNFIDEIKLGGYWFPYLNKSKIISDIIKSCKEANHVFFYYTGHLEKDELLLPINNEHFSYSYGSNKDSMLPAREINDAVVSTTAAGCDIIYVMDCCNFDGMCLPYKLLDNVYRLGYSEEKLFCKKEILCISASRNIENAISSKNGSLFSNEFFRLVSKVSLDKNIKLRDWRIMLTELNQLCGRLNDQTVNIYSSFPDTFLIWKWFVDGSNLKVVIEDNLITILR